MGYTFDYRLYTDNIDFEELMRFITDGDFESAKIFLDDEGVATNAFFHPTIDYDEDKPGNSLEFDFRKISTSFPDGSITIEGWGADIDDQFRMKFVNGKMGIVYLSDPRHLY